MVTVSDLAAMGAAASLRPGLDRGPEADRSRAAGRGWPAASAEAGCVVVGGDLSEAAVLVVSVAVVGALGRSRLLDRCSARAPVRATASL